MLLSWFRTVQLALRREEGQTTAEYALVILAAAAVAVVLIAWAKSSGKLPAFFDDIIDKVTGSADAATRAGSERGTATVEFALVLPLLLVSLALVQVGLLARDRLLVEAVARAGAREAALQADEAAIREAALAAGPGLEAAVIEFGGHAVREPSANP